MDGCESTLQNNWSCSLSAVSLLRHGPVQRGGVYFPVACPANTTAFDPKKRPRPLPSTHVYILKCCVGVVLVSWRHQGAFAAVAACLCGVMRGMWHPGFLNIRPGKSHWWPIWSSNCRPPCLL